MNQEDGRPIRGGARITGGKRDEEPIGGIIGGIGSMSSNKRCLIKSSIEEIRNIVGAIRIAEKWQECAGRHVSLKTSINRLSEGRLFIDAYNASWAANLTAMRSELLEKLNGAIEPYSVRELIFRPAYPLRRPPEQPPEKEEEITLTREEEEEAEKAAAGVRDENTRKAYLSFLKRDMIRSKEKIAGGGSRCPICGCTHEKKGICQACRRNYAAADNAPRGNEKELTHEGIYSGRNPDSV